MFLPFSEDTSFEFHAIGISHWRTPLSVREQFSISSSKLIALFERAKQMDIQNLLVISTCNRIELYSFTNNDSQLENLFLDIAENKTTLLQQYTYKKKNHEAVFHLFNVVAGIDSQILGDFEIVGQVKKALQLSQKNELANSTLIRLIEQAIKASKQIKNETSIHLGSSSVASTAVQYLQKNVGELFTKKILLIGTGKIGRIACDNLTKSIPTKNITVINRTEVKAANIGKKYQINIDKFENLSSLVNEHDIVIVATNAEQPILHKENFVANNNNKIVIDLSVPRNVAEEVKEINNLALINIEQLEDLKNDSLLSRQKSIPQAKQIIHKNMLEYYDWLHSTPISPIIKIIAEKETLEKNSETIRILAQAGLIQEEQDMSVINQKIILFLKKNYQNIEAVSLIKKAYRIAI